MKKTLIAVAFLSLVAVNAEAHGGGSSGHYHGHHGYYGASNFWWGAAFGAALTFPFYYAYSRPDPYYYYGAPPVVYANPPVYVQSQPVYVQSQSTYAAAQPRTVVTQAPNGGVIELGPANGNTPQPSAVAIPPESTQQQPAQAGKWFVYPGRGQTQAQLAADRYQCNAWAVGQTGFDPDLKVHRNPDTGPNDYGRALSACLEGRGYTVR